MPAEDLVLVVEDDDLDARQLTLALRRTAAGTRFRIERAETLGCALEALGREQPDLIALDLSLPDAGGEETFDRIREVAPAVAVVVLTGREDDDLALRLIEKGAQDYLLKSSLSPREISRCFRYAIKRAEAERAVADARRAAEEAVRAKSAFVAAMSHEVRTPLNAILGVADLLLDTPLNPDQLEYVQLFQRAGLGLLDLLNNVLELSRIESGRFELTRAPYDLAGLVSDTIEMFGFAAHRKNLGLVADVDPALPKLVGDAARIRQVLVNLVGNAVKFTESGHVRVTAGVSAGDPGSFSIQVFDSGSGIPRERLEGIFERFAQADAGVFSRHGGSGLGLALCRDLVAQMGGSIEAANRSEGSGAVFRVRLPLVPAEAPAEPAPEPVLSGRRVLLVEDDAEERRCYASWLQRSGAAVVAVSSVAEAEERLAEKGRFDAAVLDSRMPQRGGLHWAGELVRSGRLAGRLVVLLMMDHRTSDRARCDALEAAALVKPLRPRSLVEAVAGIEAGARPVTPPAVRLDLPLRILLAEDNVDNRALVKAFLRNTPVDLTCVENGRDALETRTSGSYDLILMDVSMPEMDGIEATRRIRAWEDESDARPVPILALTAHASEDVGQAASQAGANGTVTKPFDRSKLLDAIAAACQGAGSARTQPAAASAAPRPRA